MHGPTRSTDRRRPGARAGPARAPGRAPADRAGSRRPPASCDRRRHDGVDADADAVGRRDRARRRRRRGCSRAARSSASPTSRATRAPTCSSTTRAQPVERLNVADTVKVQWQAYLGAGIAAAVRHGPRAHDRSSPTPAARHDALCGVFEPARATRRSTASGAVHGAHPNARDRFAVALAKHGLGRRDIVPNVNFFKGVTRRARRRAAVRRHAVDARARTSSCGPSSP